MTRLIKSLCLYLISLWDTHFQLISNTLAVMLYNGASFQPFGSSCIQNSLAMTHLQMLNFKHHGAPFPGLMCPFYGRPALGERSLGTNSISLLHVHSKHADSSVCGKTAPGLPDVKSWTHVVSGRWFLGEAQSCCCLKYIKKHLKGRRNNKNTHSSHFLG